MASTAFTFGDPELIPSIDEVRPPFCLGCGASSFRSGRVILHGHGLRWRMLVLLPGKKRTLAGKEKAFARWVRCWVRRFRCTACGCCHSVLPEGVLLRHSYSLMVIVTAWMATVPCPLGKGQSEQAVWALLGLDRPTPERHRSGPSRWRSLSRWAGRIPAWWPGRSASGETWKQQVTSLLTGFVAEARSGEVEAVLVPAVNAHLAWGAAM